MSQNNRPKPNENQTKKSKTKSKKPKVKAKAKAPAPTVIEQQDGNNDTTASIDACALANEFLQHHYWHRGNSCLRWYRGDFYCWRDGRYRVLPVGDLRAELHRALRPAKLSYPKEVVDELLAELEATTHVHSFIDAPCWVDGTQEPCIDSIMAINNGILSASDRKLIEPTPALFNFTAAPISYDPDAKAPRWNRFMDEVFGEDFDSMATLQEWFGYCITGDTTQQKIMMLIGKERAGKGTVGRVLTALLGSENVAGIPLANLKSNFGLWPLIDKTLAIVPDARVPRNRSAAIERLLSISGEDAITVDRKYKSHWTGKLPTRLMMLTSSRCLAALDSATTQETLPK